ncbi:hypothetical protein SSX86_012972 [Deinandra increscens subsp. villosa]|uniref:Uncharacterized protein n=1 Tax=Deinandra increscens subsp. villosa TaxID=3103831 RepID=A0AAP0D6T5_9ASTR
MEWYFGNGVEDLVVPNNYEQTQITSSQGSWSEWGMTGFGSSFPRKNVNSNGNMTHEELTFNGGKDFYTSINMADTKNERSKSNNSSMSQELYNNGGSLLWNDEADFQQFAEEEARINHMDDIFFSSLLQEDPTKDSTESHDKTILGNNGHGIGSSKYLKTHAFSPSNEWANGEVSTAYQTQKSSTVVHLTCIVKVCYDCLTTAILYLTFFFPYLPQQYSSNENSMEESVLNDLERATAQFTDKTRICFRDAFYRLAESSKQSLNSCQDGESMMTSNDDTLRTGETEDSESKTNVIDRAVASLVFQKFDFEDMHSPHQADYDDYAEVPNRGMQELLQPTAY